MLMLNSLLGFAASLFILTPSLALAAPLKYEGPYGSSVVFYKDTSEPPDNYVAADWHEAGSCVNSGIVHIMPIFEGSQPSKTALFTSWTIDRSTLEYEDPDGHTPMKHYPPVGNGDKKWYDVVPGNAPFTGAQLEVYIQTQYGHEQGRTIVATFAAC